MISNIDHNRRLAGFGVLSDLSKYQIQTQFDGCRLCWAISVEGQRHPANMIVHATGEHLIVPALGALVPGYVMLISKKHRSSFATLSPQEAEKVTRDLDAVLAMLATRVRSSKWLVFEHGTTLTCGPKACCVDHLHLHLLPLDVDLAGQLANKLSCQAKPLNSMQELRAVRDEGFDNYIYVRNPDGQHYVLTPPAYSSQFVRQVIAAHVDKEAFWNWQNHPMEEKSIQTLKMLRDAEFAPRSVYYAHAIEELSPAEVNDHLKKTRDIFSTHCPRMTLLSMHEILEDALRTTDFTESQANKYLIESERKFIESSDLLIVDLSRPGWQYVGSLMEIVYATEAGIPVVAIVGKSSIQGRRWLKAHVSRFADTIEEAAQIAHELLSQGAHPG